MYEQAAGQGITPAGWYPDPQQAGSMRYWDGGAWSEHVATGYDTGYAATPAAELAGSDVYRPYQRTMTSQPQETFFEANKDSSIAIGVAAVYLVLAVVAGVHLIGVIPIMAAFRAVQRKEPIAAIAMASAIAAIVLGLVL